MSSVFLPLGEAGQRERAEEGVSSNMTLPDGKVGDRMMLRLRREDGVYATRTTANRLVTVSNRLYPICCFRTRVFEHDRHAHSIVDASDFVLSRGR